MSDDFITVGGRKPTTTVRDNSSSSIVISGSKRYPRDLGLRFGEAVQEDVRMEDLGELHPGEKWCAGECGEWRPVSYFKKDPTRADGLYPWCKACERKYYRERYAALVGHPVRNYSRRPE